MALKFGRNYRLKIQKERGSAEFTEIAYPLTAKFTVSRTVGSAINNLNMQVINLSEKTRNEIFRDFYESKVGQLKGYRRIILEAGYGEELYEIFRGNLWSSYPERKNTEIVQTIIGQDGGFALHNSRTNLTLKAGLPKKEIVERLIKQLPEVAKGFIGEITGKTKKGVVLNGDAYDLLLEKFNTGSIFIDVEKLNILKDNEYIKEKGQILKISTNSGLIGTPKRSGNFVEMSFMFEPRINIARLIEVESEISPNFDGQFKVMAVNHTATISGAVSGEATTVVQLFSGSVGNKLTAVER